jgi:hypothetical protein
MEFYLRPPERVFGRYGFEACAPRPPIKQRQLHISKYSKLTRILEKLFFFK